MKRHDLRAGTIWEGDWLQAPLEPGYTLAILDGPYGIGKAAWDKQGIDGLADWYAPHLARVSSLLAASASLYVWNTAPGLKRLDPVIRGLGWTWRADIVWDKRTPPSMLGWGTVRTWPDQTEVCGFYQRGRPHFALSDCIGNVWEYSVKALSLEQLRGPDKVNHRGSEGDIRPAIHPCEKPLAFAERMIRASTRPGDRVLVPFGGTCREAVVCEWLARTEPEQVRRFDVCELNQDGPDYIAAALAQIRGEDPRAKAAGQLRMFGAEAANG